LSVSISNPTDLEVFVENVQQEPITAYDAFGRTLTFSEAPPSGTNNIYVIYRNTVSDVHASIPDGSITFSKLANNIRLFTTDNFTGDGGTTTFNLSSDVADANTLMVAVDGVFQRAPIHYTASNSTITFSSAPPATSNVHVRHLGFRTTQTVTALPANTTISQPTLESPVYTGTLTGGTGVVNLGSGQFFKDASGIVGIGTSSPIANRRVTIRNAINSNTASTLYLATNYQSNLDTTGIDFGNDVGNSFAAIRQILTNNVNGASALAFYTSPDGTAPVARARFESNGNFLLGSTSTAFNTRFLVRSTGTGESAKGITVFGGGGDGQTFIEFVNSGGGGTGSIIQSGVGTAYTTLSDYRLKHDIQPMTGALAKVVQLKPVTYKWNADDSQSQGFIAHELQEVVPECVTGEKDAVYADGNPVYQGIDTSFLVATLTAALQEAVAEINSLKSRVETLESNQDTE
jgi:hypothetical protein